MIIVKDILSNLGIAALSAMQQQASDTFHETGRYVLLSPTGSGKTLAYLLPLCRDIDKDSEALQAVVIVPSRELALQSHDVLARMKCGVRSLCLYGGRPAMEEHRRLAAVKPHVVFATPGRLNDHLDKENFSTAAIATLVVDEFDKCLEFGFLDEMQAAVTRLPALKRLMLTSATDMESIPQFIRRCAVADRAGVRTVNFLGEAEAREERLEVKTVPAPQKDKLETLARLLSALRGEPAMVFVGYRESVERIRKYLVAEKFAAEAYHGGMEQDRRERALYKFRSGCCNVLVSTDLAARGLDIPEVRHIVHYHLPASEEAFIHRSGRTGRWDETGNVYIIVGPEEHVPEFIGEAAEWNVDGERINPV
ncbi:MAG: DEAD/DEAH box helicase, partial [Bacteroidales bacterium]